MKTLIHKNLFCSNKLYYCSVSSPNRTIIKNISNRLQITLICKCFRACVLLFIKTLFPHHIISYQSYYNRHQVLSIFINMIRILGVITAEFSSNDSYRHKKVFPNLHCDGIFFSSYKAVFQLFTNVYLLKLFQYSPRNKIQLHLPILTPIFTLTFLSIVTQTIPNYVRGDN